MIPLICSGGKPLGLGDRSEMATKRGVRRVATTAPHLYVAELQFRDNNLNDDIFGTAMEGC
jgi:hypothetical protein